MVGIEPGIFWILCWYVITSRPS